VIRALPLQRAAVAPRALLVVIAAVLVAIAAVTATIPGAPPPTAAPQAPISERLGPRTWAFAIPSGWLTAPIPGLREDDVLDLLATRPGERAIASEVASGLRVMAVGDGALVVELTADDAASIASARARGLALIPILRSTR
jgi:hypothetical protein